MAQTSAILAFLSLDNKLADDAIMYFASIDNARFRRPVGPGDQLKIESELLRGSRGVYKFKATASVDGHVAVEADLMCTIRVSSEASKQAGQ